MNEKEEKKKIIKELKKKAGIKPEKVFARIGQAQLFIKSQPLFYDKSGLWWKWNFKIFCYEIVDEVDILNSIFEELDIDTTGLDFSKEAWNTLFYIDKAEWTEELKEQKKFLDMLGKRLPEEILKEYKALEKRLSEK